eukprot:scaffold17302_cov53-Attheya_sp.AAC.7
MLTKHEQPQQKEQHPVKSKEELLAGNNSAYDIHAKAFHFTIMLKFYFKKLLRFFRVKLAVLLSFYCLRYFELSESELRKSGAVRQPPSWDIWFARE